MPPPTSSGTGKIVTRESASVDDILIEVQAAPLDSFMDNFHDVRFVAIDTEGHEPFVLAGSRGVFGKFRPAVIIEVTPSLLRRYANAEAADIFRFFDAMDYKCYGINSLSLKHIPRVEMAENGSLNWLCLPAEKAGTIGKLQTKIRIRATIPGFLLPKLA